MPKTFVLEKFISDKSMNGIGANRCFTLDRQTQHPSKVYANEILFRNELNKLRLDNLYTDVKLLCRGKEFGAHKFILASMCEFFHEIFVVRPVFERKSVNTLELNENDPCVLEALLSFIYTGEMELGNFSVEYLNDLVKCGCLWKLCSVERAVLNHLMKCLNEVTFNYAMQLAIRLDDKDCEEKILNFLCDNIEAVWVPAEFADMNEPHLHQIFNGVSETLKCHDNLLRILLTWVNFNPEERRTNLNRLLSFINFEKITITLATVLLQGKFFIGCGESRFLKEELRNKIVAFSEIKETVMPCEWQGIMNEELKKAINIVPSLDVSTTHEQFIVVVGRDESNRAVFMKYNFMLNEWSDLQDTGASLEDQPGISIYDDKIFFIGGEDFRGNKLARASFFNMDTLDFKNLPDLDVPRMTPTIIGHDNYLYVAGGVGRFGNHGLTIVEYLDLRKAENSWSPLRVLRKCRDKTGQGFVINDNIFVVGGGCPQPEYYNWKTTSWTLIKALPCDDDMKVENMYAVADGHLYAFKYYRPEYLYKLDAETDEWICVSAKGKVPEWVVATAGWKSIIFALDKARYLHTFDVVTQYWSTISRVPKSFAHPVFVGL